MKTRLSPSMTALIQVGAMFLPGIPAYIWLWPNVTGDAKTIVNVLVYLYFLAGTLLIGLRRWNLNQLAKRARISRRSISRYEHGERSTAEHGILSKLASALSVSPDYLTGTDPTIGG